MTSGAKNIIIAPKWFRLVKYPLIQRPASKERWYKKSFPEINCQTPSIMINKKLAESRSKIFFSFISESTISTVRQKRNINSNHLPIKPLRLCAGSTLLNIEIKHTNKIAINGLFKAARGKKSKRQSFLMAKFSTNQSTINK